MKTTSNSPPSEDYKALYPWASAELLSETSTLTSNEDERKHRDEEPDCKGRVFERESDAYVSVRPCAKGEPMCTDDRANEGKPFFFLYSTVFKRIKLRLPHTGFKRALLTEINVTPPQLHPNSWAFMRAFTILCNYFRHPPSVDVFLHFFEAKSPGKNLWVSFSGVAPNGGESLTLQQIMETM